MVMASNPTKYTSIHGDLGKATEFPKQQILSIVNRNYIQYLRIFIPPGAKLVTGEINEWNGQSVIARHGAPPTSSFGSIQRSTNYTLSYLESADRYYPGHAGTGKVTFLSDTFPSPYLSEERGGWFYVKVDADMGWQPDKYSNVFSLVVDSVTYNNWYDHAGSNPGGSINWANDVEGVEVYGVTGNTGPAAPDPTIYTSLHQQPVEVVYTGADGYSTSKMLTGYHDQYNLDDPIVRCKSVLPPLCEFKPNSYQYCRVNGEVKYFKVFIAPGTTSTNVTTYLVGQSSQYVAVARLRIPPQGDYESYANGISDENWLALPASGFSQSQLLSGDCIGRNASGICVIVDSNMSVPSGLEGGWLYVMLLRKKGSVIGNEFNNYVDTAAFMTWFRKKAWLASGDPMTFITGGSAEVLLSSSPSAAAFGYVKLPGSASKTIAVTNISNSNISVAISYPPCFSGNSAGGVIAVGAALQVTIIFKPTESRSYSEEIRVTSSSGVLSIPVSGVASTEVDPPQSQYQKVIDDLTQKMGDAEQAKKNLNQMLEDIGATQTCVTAAAASPAVASIPAAAAVVDFHMNKISGGYGSYGISSQVSQLTNMRDRKQQEITFFELALNIYNCLDKGFPIPADISFPPGYDRTAGELYHVDSDHPASRAKLKSGADLHIQDRPLDIEISDPVQHILPDYSKVGDIISMSEIEYICIMEGAGQAAQYYPVGLQEPFDSDLHHCEVCGGVVIPGT